MDLRFGFLNFIRSDAETNEVEGKKRADGKENFVKVASVEEVPILSKRKAFIAIAGDHDAPALAGEIVRQWTNQNTNRSHNGILSLVSGTDQFFNWKRDDYRSALQAGIVKLVSALDLLLIDDGLDYGMTKLTGSAMRADETYNSYTFATLHTPRKAPYMYFGIVPVERTTLQDAVRRLRPNTDNEIDVVPQKAGQANSAFDVNRKHSHYLLVDKSYANTGFFRVDLEKQIQNELGARDAQAKTASDAAEDAQPATYIPHIVLFFQGELDEIDRIRAYVRLRTPIIVLNNCGGMADVLAFAVQNASEPDEHRLQGTIKNRLLRSFPQLAKDNEDAQLEIIQKVVEIVRGEDGTPNDLLFVIDGGRLDTFDSLDVPFLKAVIANSAEQNANPVQLTRNTNLCITCNRPEIASECLINRPPWSHMPAAAPYTGFATALLLPGREAFVELYMQQKFPIRKFTSHLDLLQLFRRAVGKDFFTSLVWDDILGHNQSDPIREDFILTELNPLIHNLTKVNHFLDFYELSSAAYRTDDNPGYTNREDEKGLEALVVYACLLNRPQLVKIFLKHSQDPVPLAVFVETMYRGLYRHTDALDLRTGLKKQADEFGVIATDIMDMGIREAPERAKVFFNRPLPDFNNKTTVEMAFDARSKKFIAHNLVQDWLDQFSHGFVRVRGRAQDTKMLLSAYLIFPMYIWLGFPRLAFGGGQKAATAPKDTIQYEPKSLEEADQILVHLKNREFTTPMQKYREQYPPIHKMIYAVWSAPVVKFWTWCIIYILFLILLGTDMMLPACVYPGVDYAVFIVTALIWLELLTRTVYNYLWKQRFNRFVRTVDLVYQTVWNILFFLYRIAPYRWDHPFAGRVILGFGVLYYFYSVWNLFYVYDREMGPLTRVVILMFRLDVPKWITMMLPFFVSTAVVWQGIITPDWPNTGDDWRYAFYRATFTVFGSFSSELEYSAPCVAKNTINYDNFTQPSKAYPEDRCWMGDYDDFTCNTVTFWSYFFVIHYYFFLKLGMMIVLVVYYIFRQTAEMPKANIIWRYYRFHTIFDYYWRSTLPFPLNILGNLYFMFLYCGTKSERLNQIPDVEMSVSETDTFIFWKSKAATYFSQKEKQDGARAIPGKQAAIIGGVTAQLNGLINRVNELDKKLAGVDEAARDSHQRLHSASNAIRQGSSTLDIPQAASPSPHYRSRENPYANTSVRRFPVAEKLVPWNVPYDNYKPDPFSRAVQDFTPEEREFVDADLDVGRESMRRTDWNGVEYHDDDVIYRKSWIIDEDGNSVLYRQDNQSSPLNPMGRTGLRGRGNLCRFGPNHRIILAITSPIQRKMRCIFQTNGSTASLPSVPFCHYESEYSVAAVMIEAILNEEGADESDFDPVQCKSARDLMQVVPEMVRKQLLKDPEQGTIGRLNVDVRELYRGYEDTTLNTDNAWLEVLVLQIDLPFVPLSPGSTYKWKTSSTSEITMPELDMAVLRHISIS